MELSSRTEKRRQKCAFIRGKSEAEDVKMPHVRDIFALKSII